MKKILIVGVALTSFSAFADWTLKNDHNVYDLMSLSGRGKFSSETKITSAKIDDLSYTIIGQNYQTISAKGVNLEETLSFGVIENLELSLILGYELSNTTDIKYGPASTSNGTSVSLKSPGVTTPGLGATYRLLNQSNSIFNLDLSAGLSPKIGTSKDAVSGTNGNALRDSSLIIIGFNLGKKYSDMAWRIGIKDSIYGEGKSEDANDSTQKTTSKSKSNLLFDGSWQWLFSSKYVLNLNVGFGSEGESSSTDSANSTTTITKKSYTASGLDFKYLVSQNSAIGMGLMVASYDKFDIKSGSTTIPVSNYAETSWSLSYKTEF